MNRQLMITFFALDSPTCVLGPMNTTCLMDWYRIASLYELYVLTFNSLLFYHYLTGWNDGCCCIDQEARGVHQYQNAWDNGYYWNGIGRGWIICYLSKQGEYGKGALYNSTFAG